MYCVSQIKALLRPRNKQSLGKFVQCNKIFMVIMFVHSTFSTCFIIYMYFDHLHVHVSLRLLFPNFL